jgi:hypothetical protein
VWDIYSIGDSAYLQQILNAVAMLTGSGDFMVMVKIGFMVGMLVIVFQAIVEGGQGISFQNALIGWVLFSLLYGPTATVNINDVYNGQVRSVANVPYGVAAAGSMISTIGYRLTQLFEQTFSTPTMTSNGFASALQILAKVRQANLDGLSLGQVNSPNPGDDIYRSWENYVKDCTLVGVDLNQLSLQSIYSQPVPTLALKFDSDNFGTQIHVNGAVTSPTCTEAWPTLVQATNTPQFWDGLDSLMMTRLDPNNNIITSAVQTESLIDSALTQLNLSSLGARQYMIATVLLPALEDAIVGKSLSEQAFTHAVMARDAVEKRNSIWTAEQSLFFSIVRPLLTFLEGFVYAITPLMAFLIGIGAFGIAVAGKYFLTLIWIQLWMPTLAIINLYINMTASNQLAGLAVAQSMPIPSFGGIYELDKALQNYLATGAMLSAAVPAISLMLVYGGSVAAVNLARRVEGRAHIDPTVATPSTVANAPVLANAAMYTSDMAGGMVKSGAERMLPTLNLGDNRQIALSTALASGSTYQKVMSHAQSVGSQVMASTAESDSMVKSLAAGIKNDVGSVVGDTEKLAGELTAGLGAGKLGATLKSAYGTETANKILGSIARHSDVKSGKSVEAKYQDALRSDVEAGNKTAWTENLSAEDRQLVQSAQSAGMSSTMNLRDASNKIAGNPAMQKDLADYSSKTGVEGAAQAWANQNREYYGLSPGRAVDIGRLIALDNAAAKGNKEANGALLSIASRTSGLGSGYGNATPDTTAGGLSRGAVTAKGDEVGTQVLGLESTTDFDKEAHANRAYVQEKQAAAQGAMGERQAHKLTAQLQNALGENPRLLGNDPSLTKITTEGGMAALKTAGDLVKFGAAEGIAFTAGMAGKVERALDAASRAGNPAAAAKTFASEMWNGKGGSDNLKEFYNDLYKTGVDYGQKQLGLTQPQAAYYAYEQVNLIDRMTNGAGKLIGYQTKTAEQLRSAIGNDTIANALKKTAETGNHTYLGMVKEINRAHGGTF